MRSVNDAYINGAFTPVLGTEWVDIRNPADENVSCKVQLGNRDDARRAIAAAKAAQPGLRRASKTDRVELLRSIEAAFLERSQDIRDATIEEYGGPSARAGFVSQYAAQTFALAVRTLESYEFTRLVGNSIIRMEPIGVSALIVPWNSAIGTICSKVASALAAGCASIVKPSELSPLQARIAAEAFDAAGLPCGVVNIVLGRGHDVGEELSTSADVAKISFTGSTTTGKIIARAAVDTMKRVSLALSGKSASIILDDANLPVAVAMALQGGFTNNGQACVAGTRILVPRGRLDETISLVRSHVAMLKVGDPRDPTVAIGPVANQSQFDKVQHYIRRGIEEGASLVVGGEGRPKGQTKGYFVRPTVFAGVANDMDIARDEIFGPVLSLITYDNEDEAIKLANDSIYGLQAYVFSRNRERALAIADQLRAGSVLINTVRPDLLAPFGGVKQSGLGREFGVYGLEAFLEPKTEILG